MKVYSNNLNYNNYNQKTNNNLNLKGSLTIKMEETFKEKAGDKEFVDLVLNWLKKRGKKIVAKRLPETQEITADFKEKGNGFSSHLKINDVVILGNFDQKRNPIQQILSLQFFKLMFKLRINEIKKK